MSKDFFKRKEASEIEVSKCGDFDTSNFDNDLTACGIIDQEGFQKRHVKFFENFVVDSSQENPVASVTKKIQKYFSPREVAFIMAKDLLQAAYNESFNQLLKKEANGK